MPGEQEGALLARHVACDAPEGVEFIRGTHARPIAAVNVAMGGLHYTKSAVRQAIARQRPGRAMAALT